MAVTVKKVGLKSSPTVSGNSNDAKLNEMIRDRAYYLWEAKGRPEGKDMEIWIQAEREIRAKLKKK
jgi:hypothetical protein